MTKDAKKLYIVCAIIIVALLSAIALDKWGGKIAIALVFIALATLALFGIKKRISYASQKREVLLISILTAVIFVIAIQGTGFFFSFYENPYFINKRLLFSRIIPSIIIIICGELIRKVLLAQKGHFSSITSFFVGLMSELLLFYQITQFSSFNRVMDFVGLTLFPAITTGLYCHHVSKRYGAIPNIAFRLITTVYIYFVPILPSMSDALMACIKIVFPIIMLAFISKLYSKNKKKAVKKKNPLGIIATILTIAIIASVTALISCQFRFGALVIATESMTGEINKGDIIIYERYEDQSIKEGQVIIFLDNTTRIVHRVVKIENVGGELRYYTKGDANEEIDIGYRVDKDIVGLTDLKLSYLGYPTLWLREIIKNTGKEDT